MATREVAARICANAVKRLKAEILKNEATNTCSQSRAVDTRRLRRLKRQIANMLTHPITAVRVRMLNGGMAFSEIFIIGQVSPQIRQRVTSISRERTSAERPDLRSCCFSATVTALS